MDGLNTAHPAGSSGTLFSRERTVARPGFNRWLVPPAALAIHLCIGMAYGFSVFWLPLTRALGISSPVACPTPDPSTLEMLVTTTPDFDGRSFGTNVVEAALLALLGKTWAEVSPADYERVLAELKLRPRVVNLVSS